MSMELVVSDMRKYIVKAGVHPMGKGVQVVIRFPNMYGASIIRTPFSYGGTDGLCEIAVAKWSSKKKDDWSICYDTPITNDVLRRLKIDEVEKILRQIMAL